MVDLSNLSLRQKVVAVIAIILVVALIAATIVLMIRNSEVTASVRDIFIIVLALEILILDVVLIVLVLQIYRLLVYVMTELAPIIESMRDTAGTVRGTATFMSDNVVNPAIEVASKAAGVRKSLTVLFGGPNSRRRGQSAASASNSGRSASDQPVESSASSQPDHANRSSTTRQTGGSSNG